MSSAKPLKQLDVQWLTFCAEFAKTLDKQKARDKSMLPVSTINSHINDPIVQKEIANNMRSIIDQSNVDAAYLLRHLADMLESDVADAMDAWGRWLPLPQWPKILRQQLTGYKLNDHGVPYEVKFCDRLKIIELTGKHVNVAAFEERSRHVHEFSEELAQQISEGRRRAGMTYTEDGEQA